jgi:signal transduction histidine kinase
LKRILTNLINNAIQAMPKGGKLTINASKVDKKVRILVKDTGEGLSEEAKQNMFKPLFTTKAKGQGFGLAVVKRLIDSLNGNIEFESKIGEGTTVIVELSS